MRSTHQALGLTGARANSVAEDYRMIRRARAQSAGGTSKKQGRTRPMGSVSGPLSAVLLTGPSGDIRIDNTPVLGV